MFSKFIMVLTAIYILFFITSCQVVEQEPNYTYKIDSVWWSDTLDGNADGFASFKQLNFNVRLAEDVVSTINARIYYKLNSASNYSLYALSGEKTITGNNADNNLFVPIGKPNEELSRGYYNFSIEIYGKGGEQLEAKTGHKDSTILSMNAFEKSINDVSYSITPSWSNEFDRNGNGFWRYATLHLDVNYAENTERTVNAKIYYKKTSVDTFTLYHTIPNFTINDHSAQDTVSYVIGTPTIELPHGAYDFKIDLFESGNNRLVYFIDQGVPALHNIKFESEDDDSYYYSIYNVWWSNPIDMDGDGFTQFRELHFDVNVDKNEQRTLFAKIFTKTDSTNQPDTLDYALYDSTANFNITGSNSGDAYAVPIGIPNNQLDSNKYNFLISIYEASADSIKTAVISVSSAVDSVLSEQKFETIKQDSI